MPEPVSPQGQPEAPAAVPVVTPVAPSSLPNPEAAATERATQAKNPQAIRSLLSDLKKAPAMKPAEVKPADVPPAPDPIAADPAAAPSPEASEETPAPDEPAAPAADAETEEDDDGGEDPITPLIGSKTRLRLAETDKVGRLAASYLKRNRDMPMEEAVQRARAQLGIKPEPAAPEATPDPTKPQLPTTVEAVDAELERLISEEEKATIELRFEDAMKLRRSQRVLDRHRVNIERDAERQQTQQAQQYDTGFAQSEKRAVELYEFAGNPESDGGKRMLEIEAALKENDDPLHYSPDKPLRIAQMVAAELKIAPKRKGQPPAKVTPAAPAAPAQKKQVLPSGGSTTIPPASNPTTAIAEQAANVKTTHDLRKWLKPMIAQQRR